MCHRRPAGRGGAARPAPRWRTAPHARVRRRHRAGAGRRCVAPSRRLGAGRARRRGAAALARRHRPRVGEGVAPSAAGESRRVRPPGRRPGGALPVADPVLGPGGGRGARTRPGMGADTAARPPARGGSRRAPHARLRGARRPRGRTRPRHPGRDAAGGQRVLHGHRHGPHPLHLGPPRGPAGGGVVRGVPRGPHPARRDARGRGVRHRRLHAAGGGGDPGPPGDDPRVDRMSRVGAGPALGGLHGARRGGHRGHALASGRTPPRRHATLLPVHRGHRRRRRGDGRQGPRRRPARASHRPCPASARAPRSAVARHPARRAAPRCGGVAGDGAHRRRAIPSRESRGADPQPAGRAARRPGDGGGIRLPRRRPRVGARRRRRRIRV